MKPATQILSLLLLITLPQIGYSQYFQKAATDSELELSMSENSESYTSFLDVPEFELVNELKSKNFLLNCFDSFSYWVEHHKENQQSIIKDPLSLNMSVAWSSENIAMPVNLSPAIKLFSIR